MKLKAQHLKFAEGIAMGLPQADAYQQAYPKSAPSSTRSNAVRLMANDGIKAEIQRIRGKAETIAGSALMTIVEKRRFLAAVVRASVDQLPAESPLWESMKISDMGKEFKLPSKLAAIKEDNNLAGHGGGDSPVVNNYISLADLPDTSDLRPKAPIKLGIDR